MKMTLHPYRLEFVFPFRIAHGVRTHTDAVFVELELDGIRAFGEATLPPYLPYTQESTMKCLSRVDLSHIDFPYQTHEFLSSSGIMSSMMEAPAMAALDMALWTLEAKMKNTTISSLLGITGVDQSIRTYTIAVCDREEMKDRIAFGKERGFSTFKLKFNGTDDKRMLEDFRCLSNAPFAVDANQGWGDADHTIDFAKELQQQGCLLIEQPFDKADAVNTMKLKRSISIPVIADEACQNYRDIERVEMAYSGVNIKLQKCGGLTEALRIVKMAKAKKLKLLIGCMSESTIGCDAAEALSPLCDWNDLDGKYLVKEVPFKN